MATKMTKVNPPAAERIETVTEAVAEKKQYEKDELIPCRSICNGRLFIDGNRSKVFYQWADYGDVVGVEYQDLIYMIHSRDSNIMEPRIIIEDEEIVADNSSLTDLYNALYSTSDLKDILNLNPRQMKEEINKLPSGAKNSIKGLVSTMIDTGELDSVAKIKVIDEIFGTKLLLTLAQN